MGQQLELFPRHEARTPALGLISAEPGSDSVGLTVTILQSGSAGNATLVQAAGTALLIDCGLPPKRLAPCLRDRGLQPGDLAAVLVTHEHGDHIGGCAKLSARFGVPLYMTEGTLRAGRKRLGETIARDAVRILPERGWLAFHEGLESEADPDSVDLSVDWVPVSHDGRETVSYAVQRNNFRFGVMTDLGVVTDPVRRMMRSLDAVSLETNHDVELLRMSPYPPFLKRRILGPGGHLSNAQAAALVREEAGPRLRWIFCAHISENANTTERVLAAMAPVSEDRELRLTEHRAPIAPVEF